VRPRCLPVISLQVPVRRDWRRLETRWVKPVKPGDTIQPTGIVKSKQATANSRWMLIDVMVKNQSGDKGRRADSL
jgi:acyl dehydratase